MTEPTWVCFGGRPTAAIACRETARTSQLVVQVRRINEFLRCAEIEVTGQGISASLRRKKRHVIVPYRSGSQILIYHASVNNAGATDIHLDRPIMPLALSVFGVSVANGAATFCYAQLRTLKRAPRYSQPSLPTAAAERGLSKVCAEGREFELHVWDVLLGDEESAQVEADIQRGLLCLPERCPIRPGTTLTGIPFPETLLPEQQQRISVEGEGALLTHGFAIEHGAIDVIAAFQDGLGRKAVGEELNALLAILDQEAGLQGLAISTRRLGIVEHLMRQRPDAETPFVEVNLVKADRRSREPCREIVLRRPTHSPDIALRVVLSAKSGNAVILCRLVTMAVGQAEVSVDTGAHVTSLTVSVFDEITGDLIDLQVQNFIQRIGIGLVGHGATDILPPPFRGARAGNDLIERPRINTATFSIDGGDRSAGLDVMMRNAAAFDALAGSRTSALESHFFQTGVDPQIDVIRWMKLKIEDADTKEAFLIDPFLGTEALKRVVLRQGNESVKLTIIVSPANVDPDASCTDVTIAPGKHINELIDSADALADELCGDIEIIHVRRGGGTRQAFHDRYFGLVTRDGGTRAFLLSNSLSKAAGDWPFTVAEVDVPTAWHIAAYVASLTKGHDGSGRELEATSIWKSKDASAPAPFAAPGEGSAFQSVLWSVYLELFGLNTKGGIYDRTLTDPVVDRLASAPRQSFDDKELADLVVEGMAGRDHFLLGIVERLSQLSNFRAVAAFIGESLVDRLFERLASATTSPPEPLPLLRFAGQALSRRPKGTIFLRNQINPLLDRYALNLQIERVPNQIQQLIAGLGLVIVGLELAHAHSEVPMKFRQGIAKDYVHLLGQLLSSSISRRVFAERPKEEAFPGLDLAREALRLVCTLAGDQTFNLKEAADLLLDDPLLPSDLKGDNAVRTYKSGLTRGEAPGG